MMKMKKVTNSNLVRFAFRFSMKTRLFSCSDEDDEDDDLSDEEPDADDLQSLFCFSSNICSRTSFLFLASKGEKRKRDSEDAEDNESKDQKKDEAESTEQD